MDRPEEVVPVAAEGDAPFSCQEADAMAEEDSAANATGVLGPMVQGNGTPCMRQELPDVNGSYVFGKLQGLAVTYTVDNGVSDMIVNPRVYKRIPEDVWPQLFQASQWVKGAESEPFKIWGQVPFDLQLGPMSLQRVLIVAEIEDQVLLSTDILRRDPEGPMEILNTEKVMVFKGLWIPLRTVGEQKQKIKVLAVNTLVLPGMTEQIVDGYLDWSEEDEGAEQCMLVKSDPQFKQRYGCMVVPAVVDVAGRTTTRVRVFNPYAELVTIHGDVVMAGMEET